MAGTITPALVDEIWIESVYRRLSRELYWVLERGLLVLDLVVEARHERPAGPECVHLSFRFDLRCGRASRQGFFLVPAADGTAMASYLLMLSDRSVALQRRLARPDVTMKQAMLDLGRYMAEAVERGSRKRYGGRLEVRFAGCQGVRPGVRPALEYDEGDALLVGHALLQLGTSPPFDGILALPCLD